MHGIVSLLDGLHSQYVEELWSELKREFGVEGVYVTPFPHFSYQVANNYDVESLTTTLSTFATKHAPFQVRTNGLGVFNGQAPVLYIPVVRDPTLTNFHKALWQALTNTGDGLQAYYQPEHWMPHITIGIRDLNSDSLALIMRYLNGRDFNWHIHVDNLALIYDTGERQEAKHRFKLG